MLLSRVKHNVVFQNCIIEGYSTVVKGHMHNKLNKDIKLIETNCEISKHVADVQNYNLNQSDRYILAR